MDKIVAGFLERNLYNFKDNIEVNIAGGASDYYTLSANNGRVYVEANNYISAFTGIYDYLKKYCGVQLSWCGNRKIHIKELAMFDGKLSRTIEQKFRVYMNYCTLDYSMCWWDFERWEQEIDFMAMNGINMPLAVIGTEAVWFELLLDYGFNEREALDWISGPAFWAWQLMTNIEGYLPPPDKEYVYHRLELGRRILDRYIDFGMQPIQQGFSGHVPMLFKSRFANVRILEQKGWCRFPETAQLDPTDSFFLEFGSAYLYKLKKLMGTHHYFACDPFHEGTPPKPWFWYLKSVGRTINKMYEDFDKDSVWVMQTWSMRKHIVKAVPEKRLLLLDINSEKTSKCRNLWGYPVVAGMLHNFGGKNAMQGKLKLHCTNRYLQLKSGGANVVGTGMFMEGIEQNPVIYDLQFELLTSSNQIDWSEWLDDYIKRRYGKYSRTLRKAWDILLETCYRNDGYHENEVGSVLAARPQLMPIRTGPCCFTKIYYDTKQFEMAGFYSSSIISYGNDKAGRLRLMRHLTVPTLRFQPNLTGSSFSHNYSGDAFAVKVNGRRLNEYPELIGIKGNLKIVSSADFETKIVRELLPAVNYGALIEKVTVLNASRFSQEYSVCAEKYSKKVNEFWCVGKSITAECSVLFDDTFKSAEKRCRKFILRPNEDFSFYCVYYAYQSKRLSAFSLSEEMAARKSFVDEMFTSLKLKTPYPELDAQLSHCILRGSESIFKTKSGLMHSPGGGNYYAALWTNDQCEYANPFFPFSGYQAGIEQSINCYSLYEKYMDKSDKPIREKQALVTSIIAEGDGFWNGAGDRGDGEMYAYGLSRFLLEMSDVKLINRFWDNLVWCLDFALSRKNERGVISSDSDELENRFESGNANLFTSCITYDALGNASVLAEIIGDDNHKRLWEKERIKLKAAIETYFGSNVEGFDTYQYYEGNKDLRSWICMPLTVGIFDRADQTIKALFSPRLYNNGMMKSTSANNTTWDRSLLFALRRTFLAGYAETGIKETVHYCKNRLLGSHCPYPFEAYPEGNRAHLAAESLLFARIITEGLFGLKAVGLNKLKINPQLSEKCSDISLQNIRLFSKCFDITANQKGVAVIYDGNTYQSDNNDVVFDFNSCSFI